VDSLVLSLTPATTSPPARDPALLARVVKAAFGQRRKTLNNTLTAGAAFGLSPAEVRRAFGELGLDAGRRGETLSLSEFVALANKLSAISGQLSANN
jgi:16S rRNA (adenine1518-N6/adenine1519-N6)-dimethyltransferase